MSAPRTYLDWNATAPLRPEARAAMLAALDCVGNASSPHWEGRRARAVIEAAREQIGGAFGRQPRHVYFTSGATEAANWLLTPNVVAGGRRPQPQVLLVGATEHAAVRDGHRFCRPQVEEIPVDGDGVVELVWLERRLQELTARHGSGAVMVALQAANNETGVLQPLAAIARLLAAVEAIWVCDAVQAATRVPLEAAAIGGAALVLSGHKLGGPKGAGAVIFANDDVYPEPLLRGGGQERRQRSGTENVAAIAGLAAALSAAAAEREEVAARTERLKRRFEEGLRQLRRDAVVFAEAAPRLANTSAFALPGLAAETALIALDLAGVSVSSGSACSSGKVAPSHVLAAMRVAPSLAGAALRVSSGWSTSEAEIDRCLAAIARIDRAHQERRQRPAVAERQVA
jgi:cysteine desulfurase